MNPAMNSNNQPQRQFMNQPQPVLMQQQPGLPQQSNFQPGPRTDNQNQMVQTMGNKIQEQVTQQVNKGSA
jgi:hypothetical protein